MVWEECLSLVINISVLFGDPSAATSVTSPHALPPSCLSCHSFGLICFIVSFAHDGLRINVHLCLMKKVSLQSPVNNNLLPESRPISLWFLFLPSSNCYLLFLVKNQMASLICNVLAYFKFAAMLSEKLNLSFYNNVHSKTFNSFLSLALYCTCLCYHFIH